MVEPEVPFPAIDHAARLGASSAELIESGGQSEDERRLADSRLEQELAASERRAAAVREAYWEYSDLESGEFAVLQTELRSLGIAPEVTSQRALFDLLPAGIIGQGVQWSFSDAGVVAAIHDYVDDHRLEIWAALTTR